MVRALTLTALLAASCAAPVAFECDDDAPLCMINALIDDPRPDATGIRITRVALYQGLEVELMKGNEPGSMALPIVAGRDAVVRVFVDPVEGFRDRAITARVWLYRDGVTIGAGQATSTISAASTQGLYDSTLNIELPGSMIPSGELTWSVELLEANASVLSSGVAIGSYPTQGQASLTAHFVGPTMRVYLVPIEWNADNSGRTTNIDDAALAYYHESLHSIFPTAAVDIEVGEPWPWDKEVSNMNLWSELLGEMVMVRRERGVPGDVYIYGVFDPGGSSTGGVAGLSMLAGVPEHEVGRSSIGISRGAGDGGSTMAHELGHAAGRPHSPCGGAAGPDPAYPHDNAHLGTWGLYAQRSMMIDPNEFHDFMSYCGPPWVSDYNWDILFARQRDIHEYYHGGSVAKIRHEGWRMVWLHADGSAHHHDTVWLTRPPDGEWTEVTWVEGGQTHTARGVLTPFSHVDGGVLHVPTIGEIAELRLGEGPTILPKQLRGPARIDAQAR